MIELICDICELLLLIGFIAMVHMDAPIRFIFLSGVLYLASVIRHCKDGGGA